MDGHLNDHVNGLAELKRFAPIAPSAWKEKLELGAVSEAFLAIEQALQEQPDDPVARLWWVRCALASGGVPLSALSAPLQELAEPVRARNDLTALGATTHYLLAKSLAERNQLRLAANLAYEAAKLAERTTDLSSAEHNELIRSCRDILKAEVERAEQKKERREYQETIRAHFAELDRSAGRPRRDQPKQRNDERAAPRGKRLSAKTLLGEVGAQSPDDHAASHNGLADSDESPFVLGDGHWGSNGEGPTSLAPTAVSSSRGTDVSHSPELRTRTIITATAAILLILTGLWEIAFPRRSAEVPGTLLAMRAPLPDSPLDPALPSARPRGSDVLSHRMSALNDSLSAMTERLRSVTPGQDAQAGKSVEELRADPEVDTKALDPRTVSSLPRPRPKDGDELVTLDGRQPVPQAEPLDPRRAPVLDPNRLSKLPVDSLEANPRRNAIEPTPPGDAVAMEPRLPAPPAGREDIRRYPLDRGPAPIPPQREPSRIAEDGSVAYDPEGITLDGRPVRAYPVERMDGPLIYRTITATNVLAAPSLLAASIARLAPDTSIQVVSKVGQWLELRSTGGRRGYIYAQDAVRSER